MIKFTAAALLTAFTPVKAEKSKFLEEIYRDKDFTMSYEYWVTDVELGICIWTEVRQGINIDTWFEQEGIGGDGWLERGFFLTGSDFAKTKLEEIDEAT